MNALSSIQLLDYAAAILKMKKECPTTPGEKFNIFSILNMETDEVNTHCRLLYELLSPDGSHGMVDQFLRAFFEMVLHKPYCESVSVYREYAIEKQTDDDYGRIDLLVQGKDTCYPIEVKVYAGDQWEQIDRYSRFASKAKENQVYYLTLDGHDPSEESKRESEAISISFAAEIRNWLVRCGEIAWNIPSVAEVIRQYIQLIDKLTGKYMEDAYMNQIKEAVKSSQINFESALAISSVVTSLQQEMLQQVFQEIEKHMDEMKDPLEKVMFDYTGSYPGVGYRLKEYDEWIVILNFENSDGLYFGISLLNRKTKTPCTFPEDIQCLEGAFPSQKWREQILKLSTARQVKNRWWLWGKYLPDESEKLDLRRMNGCRYTELFDPEKHKILMNKIFAEIDSHIETIRKTGLYD